MAERLPSVSVVVVTRDRPTLLADALRGIAGQRLPPLEVRIADDGEHPLPHDLAGAGTLETVVIPVRAGLAAAARNRGSAGARGDVLAFHDDDDRWLPDHLLGLAEAFRDPTLAFAWRDCAIIREEVSPGGVRHERDRRVIAHGWDPDLMRHDDYLPPSAWGVRRSLFERLGGFDETFRFSEDWDFALRAAAQTTPRRVAGVTVEVRVREAGNLSSDAGPERLACLKRLEARHGLPSLEPKTFWEVARVVEAAAARRPPVSADLVIVGAGPAGVSAALWARTMELSVVVLEAGGTAGGQLLHIHHPIVNLAGAPGDDGPALACALAADLERAGVEVRYGVAAAELDPASMSVRAAGGERFPGSAVLVATGVRRRRLE
ncbi:MAG: glycosyltransferase, partial [Candidatus Eiseniibacteriota bacterium]